MSDYFLVGEQWLLVGRCCYCSTERRKLFPLVPNLYAKLSKPYPGCRFIFPECHTIPLNFLYTELFVTLNMCTTCVFCSSVLWDRYRASVPLLLGLAEDECGGPEAGGKTHGRLLERSTGGRGQPLQTAHRSDTSPVCKMFRALKLKVKKLKVDTSSLNFTTLLRHTK